MTSPTPLPCGAWPSPLSPDQAASGAVSLSFPTASKGVLYWIEGRPSERGRSVLMARDAKGEIAEVLDAQANVRSRVHEYGGLPYAPVGDRLVWSQFDDQRLRVRSVNGDIKTHTPAGCRYADGVAAPDGRSLLSVREDHRGNGGEPANSIVLVDLDAAEDDGRVLVGDHDFVAWPRVSLDGRRLACVAWDHPAMPWDATLLIVGELGGAGPLANVQTVAGGTGESVLDPQWDADGSLYFLSDRSGWWNLHRWRDGTVKAVTTLTAEIGGALWQLGMHWYALTGDGRAVLRISREATDSLAVLDLATLERHDLELPFVEFNSLGLLDANTAFAIASAVDGLPALITIDLQTGAHQVVRRAGADPMASADVSRAEAIEFTTTAGPAGEPRTAHAWFYPPHHARCVPMPGELPPLLVLMHGGPTAQVGRGLKLAVQLWTSRGFAVVDINYGGSTGYGRAYRERLRGQWGVIDLQDAVAAVEHLASTGRIDGGRVAIRGGSAGGFTVLSALAFTTRFAAGINYYGVADLETLATDTHKFESRYLDSLVAPLPEGIDFYRARSPVHHMAACRAALITFQGSDDKAVPPQQSQAIVAAARAAGCPVAYLEFPGEGHGFRQGPNIVRALQSELVFLGRVFRYSPAGDFPEVTIENASAL